MTVRSPTEVTTADLAQVGGKAANLGELMAHGFPIPLGFVICADTYAGALASIEIDPDLAAIRRRLIEDDFAPHVKRDILAAHDQIQAARVRPVVYAVRSSATAEDSSVASFAGQHETYYYVTATNLLEMIRKCWASLWNEAAVSYRRTQGIEHAAVLMAVIVQEMIPSQVSGVTFTANPVTGDSDEIVTEATWGMGAAIVDGRVSPDHFVVRRTDSYVLQKRVANKKLMVSSDMPADQNRMVEVPFHRRQVSSLTDAMLNEVTHWGIKAEAHFGAPQDVEWAVYGEQYYMLQSRPITMMGEEAFAANERRKLVLFKPMAENFTEPVLPLTQDCMPPGMHWVKGRCYGDLIATHLLIPIKLTNEQAAQLTYLERPDDLEIKISWWKLPFTLVNWFFVYLAFGALPARSRAMPDDFMTSFREFVAEVEADETLSPRASMVKLFTGARPFSPIGQFVIWLNVTAGMRYILLMGILNKLLAYWSPEMRVDAASLLCSGSEGILSAEMGRWIFALSKSAKAIPEVTACMHGHAPDTMLEALEREPRAKPFVDELERFLDVHGHRGLKEFEMASVRFEEDPSPVLAMIKNYLASDVDAMEMERRSTVSRDALIVEIKKKLAALRFERILGLRWRIIDCLARRARYFIKLRENSRFYHIMAWYAARKRILEAERALLAAGKLKVKDDVFYLHWAEVAALVAGELAWREVEDRIRERRLEIIRWSKLTPPKTINIATSRTAERAVFDGESLLGQGAAPGTYEGIARVILDPGIDAQLHPGEILIAPYTDPAWTPLFLTAHAAVVEVGSYLSHAGTIAREYGMPCVVDVAGCTRHIKTGDRVFVDGTHGVVRLLSGQEQAA